MSLQALTRPSFQAELDLRIAADEFSFSSVSFSLSLVESLLSTLCGDRAGRVITVNVSEMTIAVSVGVVDEEGNIFSGVSWHVHIQIQTRD